MWFKERLNNTETENSTKKIDEWECSTHGRECEMNSGFLLENIVGSVRLGFLDIDGRVTFIKTDLIVDCIETVQ
jgi:hypothetical protein